MKKLLNEWRQYVAEATAQLTPLEAAIKDPKLRLKWPHKVTPLGWRRLEVAYKRGGLDAISQSQRDLTTGLLSDKGAADKERWGSPSWEALRQGKTDPRGTMKIASADLLPSQVRRREREEAETIKIKEPLKVTAKDAKTKGTKEEPQELGPEHPYRKNIFPGDFSRGTKIAVDKGDATVLPIRDE